MSLQANIEHLAATHGIEAVLVEGRGAREHRGAEAWYALLDGALTLASKCTEASVRVVLSKHTLVIQREGDETVAVVLPTGHPVAKSLRRMIRRLSAKDRGPVSVPRDSAGAVFRSDAPYP